MPVAMSLLLVVVLPLQQTRNRLSREVAFYDNEIWFLGSIPIQYSSDNGWDQLPTALSPALLLRTVENYASLSEISINDIMISSVALVQNNLHGYAVNLNLRGSYSALMLFVNSIEFSDDLVQVISFSFQSEARDNVMLLSLNLIFWGREEEVHTWTDESRERSNPFAPP
jgi:hypothetical protein